MVLVGIFVALPVVLYGQFESADRQMRDLVTRAIQDRSALIAEALAPKLTSGDKSARASLNDDLAKYSSDGTILKLMFQPGEERHAGRFYFVASAPKIRADEIAAELDELGQRGILQRISDACMWDAANEIRYKQANGTVELLTSIIPIRAADGCWVLTSTHTTSEFLNTSIGRPYWETREIRVAAAIYLVLAVIALLVAVSIRLSLRRFRDVAAEISQGRIGDNAFSHRNVVPELSSVARDFDKLVHDLGASPSRSARTPRTRRIPSRRRSPPSAPPSSRCGAPCRSTMRAPSARSRSSIPRSTRLLDLVIAAQRHDISTAELIEAPRLPTDFTQLVGDAALHFREILATKDIRLIRRLDERAIVRAGQGMLETVLQCVLENAISFSPRGGTIIVTLTVNSETVELQVDDEGPGVDPAKIPHMFERYFSSRPEDDQNAPPSGHAGLGLWIVRRNVETLGGRVSAANRIGGGLSISISLPRNGA